MEIASSLTVQKSMDCQMIISGYLIMIVLIIIFNMMKKGGD